MRKLIKIPAMMLVTDRLGYLQVEGLDSWQAKKLEGLPGAEVIEIPELAHGARVVVSCGNEASFIGPTADWTKAIIEYADCEYPIRRVEWSEISLPDEEVPLSDEAASLEE